jgi:phospholipase D1/2
LTQILRAGRNAWKTVAPAEAGLLVDADDYYRAFYSAVHRAERYILMSGWQFDSGVPLLRGRDVPAGADVRFLKCLNGLCEAKPDLQIYILAWNFHVAFALEREWMQRVLFHWLTSSRFRFLFDDCPVSGGSHHQKFVVVDGRLGFLGGMDVCESRWDDRRHLAVNPLRLSRGRPVKPYHDVQVYLSGGDAAAALQELFVDRWARAGGDPLALHAPSEGERRPDLPSGAIVIGDAPVALSRTDPRAPGEEIVEVEQLFLDAIDAAERLIYLETQYFSSRKIYGALVRRLRAPDRPALEVVVVVNERAEALKEELAVGLRQAKILEGLRHAVKGTAHRLGLYYSLCEGADETFRATYIHSKVIAVDDRFLTVGSANLTNRSMGVDSELHASWEASTPSPEAARLTRVIRRIRVSLLAEHAGAAGVRAIRGLHPIGGLVARLDDLSRRPGARLQSHGPPTPVQAAALDVIDPQDLPFDPELPDVDPSAHDEPSDEAHRRRPGRVRHGLAAAWRRAGLKLSKREP